MSRTDWVQRRALAPGRSRGGAGLPCSRHLLTHGAQFKFVDTHSLIHCQHTLHTYIHTHIYTHTHTHTHIYIYIYIAGRGI